MIDSRKALQEKAHRFLCDKWEDDLRIAMWGMVGITREAKWVAKDITYNWLKQIYTDTNTVYDEEPLAQNDQDSGFAQIFSESGYWSFMPEQQLATRAMGEVVIFYDIVDDQLVFDFVAPYLIDIQTKPGSSEITQLIRKIEIDGKTGFWVYDVSDPANPSRRAFIDSIAQVNDVTDKFWDDSETGYPYWIDGKPIIPATIKHAKLTGKTWNPDHVRQTTNATVMIGMGYSFYWHLVFHASWPQRYMAGYQPVGFDIQESGLIVPNNNGTPTVSSTFDAIRSYDSDAQQIAVFEPTGNAQGLIGQWSAASDPRSLMESIKLYEYGLANLAGLDQSDVIRTSGDPQAGIALIVSAEGKKRQQRKQLPACRKADLEVISKCAGLWNSYFGTNFPTRGWSLQYPSLPLGPLEQQALRDDLSFKLDKRFISQRQAMRELYPYKTERQIDAMIAEIEAETSGPEMEPDPQDPNEPVEMPEEMPMQDSENMQAST